MRFSRHPGRMTVLSAVVLVLVLLAAIDRDREYAPAPWRPSAGLTHPPAVPAPAVLPAAGPTAPTAPAAAPSRLPAAAAVRPAAVPTEPVAPSRSPVVVGGPTVVRPAAPATARPAPAGRSAPTDVVPASPPVGGPLPATAPPAVAVRRSRPDAATGQAMAPAAASVTPPTPAAAAGAGRYEPSRAAAVASPTAVPAPTAVAPLAAARPVGVPVPAVARPAPPGFVGVPLFRATNGNGVEQAAFDIPARIGAGTWYANGFTGTRAMAANIEGGHAWNGHETLNWVPDANYFQGSPASGALSGAASLQAHATGVSATIAGKGATTRQQGVAPGIDPANFFTGNIATAFGSGGSFNISLASLYEPYRDALVTGINGNAASVVDVINSSWGGEGATGYEFGDFSRSIDALVYRANTTDADRHGVTAVFAAGNSGPGGNSVGFPASGLNGFVVAALGGLSGSTGGLPLYNDLSIFSSRGPQDAFIPNGPTAFPGGTGADGGVVVSAARARIDIAAPGEYMFLPFTTTGATSYQELQGTSFAAPTVAGGVALLADYARATFPNPTDLRDAIDTRVVKAVLMNSADKTAGWTNAQALAAGSMRTTRSLDFDTGAGRMNLDQAFRQYASAGTRLLAAGATNTGLAATGWARGDLDRPNPNDAASNDFFLAGTLNGLSELNVTLSWLANRGLTDLATGASTEVGFHDLRLEVWRYNPGDNSLIARVAESDARYIANEHVSFLLPQDGSYMIRVARPGGPLGQVYSFAGDATNDAYGLAWMNRQSAVFTSGRTTNPAIDATTAGLTPNVLVAPAAGQTAELVFDAGTTNIANTLYLGGTDRGPGGAASLELQGTAALNVGSHLRVFSGGAVTVGAGTALYAGALDLDAGGRVSFTGSGTSTLRFTQLNVAGGSLLAEAGHTANLGGMFEGFSNTIISRANVAGPLQIGGAGNITVTAGVPGNGDITKVGAGTLNFAANTSGASTRTLDIQEGTVRLTGFNQVLAAGTNVSVAAGATFDIQNTGNSPATAIGTLNLTGGLFRVPFGSADYFLNRLTATGGALDYTGTSDFWLHFVGAGAGITTNAAATTVTWTGAGTSRFQNDTTAALPIAVASGTAASGVDFDIGAIVSNGGTNANYTKLGAGTLRLTNAGNTGNFTVQAGRLRVDAMPALGSGAVTLAGGTLTYGGATASSAKALTVGTGGGTVEVPTAATTLTLTGAVGFGGNAFAKAGAGTLVLAGANSGTAAVTTSVNGGTLRLGANGALPAGSSVVVNAGGTLDVRAVADVAVQVNAGGAAVVDGTVGRAVTVASGGTLAGTAGSVVGNVSVAGTLRPGQPTTVSAGLFTLSGGAGQTLSFSAGGVYLWDLVAESEDGPGVSFDQVVASDGAGVDLSAGALTLAFAAGATPDAASPFWQADRQWTVLDVTGGGANASQFVGITNAGAFASVGAFSLLSGADGDVILSFQPVPEPGLVLAVAAVGLVGRRLVVRRRG